MMGLQFRRQRPILSYIVDFVCLELKLVVEVDGYSHQLEEVHLRDMKKEDDLRNAGFRILRFTDNEVLNHMQMVKEEIERTIISVREET